MVSKRPSNPKEIFHNVTLWRVLLSVNDWIQHSVQGTGKEAKSLFGLIDLSFKIKSIRTAVLTVWHWMFEISDDCQQSKTTFARWPQHSHGCEWSCLLPIGYVVQCSTSSLTAWRRSISTDWVAFLLPVIRPVSLVTECQPNEPAGECFWSWWMRNNPHLALDPLPLCVA